MSKKKSKHKATRFLERNEIWFKTVLSLAATVAALLVSIASYNIARYQAELSATIAERENRERQPFFSIDNTFDEERNQYIYSIVNTGGEVRDVYVSVSPFFYMAQEYTADDPLFPVRNDDIKERERLNVGFIYLPDMFCYENCEKPNGLFSFSDVWVDMPSRYYPGGSEIVEDTETMLANSHLTHVASTYNLDELDTFISCYLVYYVEITYTNYENSIDQKMFWLSRRADVSDRAEGNVILGKSVSIERDFERAVSEDNVLRVDSMNMELHEAIEECDMYIQELLEKFGQSRPSD